MSRSLCVWLTLVISHESVNWLSSMKLVMIRPSVDVSNAETGFFKKKKKWAVMWLWPFELLLNSDFGLFSTSSCVTSDSLNPSHFLLMFFFIVGFHRKNSMSSFTEAFIKFVGIHVQGISAPISNSIYHFPDFFSALRFLEMRTFFAKTCLCLLGLRFKFISDISKTIPIFFRWRVMGNVLQIVSPTL